MLFTKHVTASVLYKLTFEDDLSRFDYHRYPVSSIKPSLHTVTVLRKTDSKVRITSTNMARHFFVYLSRIYSYTSLSFAIMSQQRPDYYSEASPVAVSI